MAVGRRDASWVRPRRRDVLGACLALAGCRGAVAAEPRRIVLLGAGVETEAPNRALLGFVRTGLARMHLREGVDVVLETRWPSADYRSYPSLAAEIAASRPALVLVVTIPGAVAMRDAAPDLPVVMLYLNDPVAAGLVRSLARPGGSITGMAVNVEEILPKAFDVLASLKPETTRVGVIGNPLNPSNPVLARALGAALARRGAEALDLPCRNLQDLAAIDRPLADAPVDALMVLPDSTLLAMATPIVELGRARGLAIGSLIRLYPDRGALFSYGFVQAAIVQRAMYFVRRILDGARPADLPIEQPTEFEFVLNARTARDLRLSIPPHILAQADEVIE